IVFNDPLSSRAPGDDRGIDALLVCLNVRILTGLQRELVLVGFAAAQLARDCFSRVQSKCLGSGGVWMSALDSRLLGGQCHIKDCRQAESVHTSRRNLMDRELHNFFVRLPGSGNKGCGTKYIPYLCPFQERFRTRIGQFRTLTRYPVGLSAYLVALLIGSDGDLRRQRTSFVTFRALPPVVVKGTNLKNRIVERLKCPEFKRHLLFSLSQ